MYDTTDIANFQRLYRKRILLIGAGTIPFLAVAIMGFFVRNALLTTASFILAGSVVFFFGDLYAAPVRHYLRFLKEITSGRTHETFGTLVSIGDTAVFEQNCLFYELILNVYEEQTPDGERRFLLDCMKNRPIELLGKDVLVTSHGALVTRIETSSQAKRRKSNEPKG